MPRLCRGVRRRCPEHLCGVDVDDIFAYSAVKSVKIHDARLGLLHYVMMFLIVLYILVYQLIAKNGYLKFSPAQNSVRLSLQEPTQGCNPNKPSCKDAFAPLSRLPYCCARNASCTAASDGSCACDYRPAFKNYQCTWMAGDDAGRVEESSMMVVTLTHEYSQTRNATCFAGFPAGADACDRVWLIDSSRLFFTADVESYTLLIDHSVMTPQSDLAVTSREMDGMLHVPGTKDLQQRLCASHPGAVDSAQGGRPTSKAPCYLPPQKAEGLDYFTVGTLLQAMGVSLEDASYDGSDHSARYEGLVANLVIEYSNTEAWRGVRATRYVFRPSVVPGSTYKKTALIAGQQPDKRVKQDLHGILFEVTPGGGLAAFNFTQALLQLTTSLTLLAMATVGVNVLAQYVLRHRHYYNEALYEHTVDFSDLTVLEQQPEEAIEEELRRRHLPVSGSKYRRIMRLLEHGFKPPDAAAGGGGAEITAEAAAARPPSSSAAVVEQLSRPMLRPPGSQGGP